MGRRCCELLLFGDIGGMEGGFWGCSVFPRCHMALTSSSQRAPDGGFALHDEALTARRAEDGLESILKAS